MSARVPNVLLICFLLSISLRGTRAADVPGTPVDYYKLGEIAHVLGSFEYHHAISGEAKQKLSEHLEFMTKLNLSKDTLSTYAAYSAKVAEMPFAEDYAKWKKEDQAWWSTDGTYGKLLTALKTDVAKTPSSDFFYWLGFNSIRCGWTLASYGNKVSDAKATVKTSLIDAAWLATQKEVELLAPDVQEAVKAMAKFKVKIDDPLSDGINASDLARIVELGQKIRDAQKENRLLK